MWDTFKYTVRILLRTPATFVWALGFPIVLAAIFMMMFSSLTNDGHLDPVPVAVVTDDAWRFSPFQAVVAVLSEDGENRLLDVYEVADADEAEALLVAGEVAGAYTVGKDGAPELLLPSEWADSEVESSILEAVASSYKQNVGLIEQVAREDPAALADAAAVERALGVQTQVKTVSLTRATPDETVRYYYALLGMASLFAAQLAAGALVNAQPNLSAVGARTRVGGLSGTRRLVALLCGSWVVSFGCLAVVFAFIRVVAGVDFAGRDVLCLVGCAAAALLATGIGAAVGAAPIAGGMDARSGILTGLTCLMSLFAGLYGEPCMELADSVVAAVPAMSWINPARLICDEFYSLYYYESLGPFWLRAAACAAFAAALLGLAAALFRRQRYEHL